MVDAFTPIPFSGNPAGVVMLDGVGVAPEKWLQSVAGEMKHAETAFLRKREGKAGGGGGVAGSWHYDLRWFTPESEVDLCGHATLASAHLIFELQKDAPAKLVFHTKSGELSCRRMEGGRIEMDFPSLSVEKGIAPEGLLKSLGVSKPMFVGKSQFDYLVELKSEKEVRELRPNLLTLAGVDCRGVIVAARGGKVGAKSAGMYDVVSRFFAPRVGVPEDPVTGSAHCVLSPYFSSALGKGKLTCYQASPRGGIVNTEHKGERTLLSGEAVTILSGMLVGWK